MAGNRTACSGGRLPDKAKAGQERTAWAAVVLPGGKRESAPGHGFIARDGVSLRCIGPVRTGCRC
jgi:hypothetical protein